MANNIEIPPQNRNGRLNSGAIRGKLLRLLTAIAGMFVLACVVTPVVQSQYVDNNPDVNPCKPCRWTYPVWDSIPVQKKIISVYGYCHYEVSYKKRLCRLDYCYDVEIINIKPVDESYCEDSLTTAEIAQLVTGHILEHNSFGLPPSEEGHGNGGYCWRIIKPACWTRVMPGDSCFSWRQYSVPVGPPIVVGPDTTYADSTVIEFEPGDIVGCNSDHCCTNMYFVSRNLCGMYYFLEVPRHQLDNLTSNELYGREFYDQFDDTNCEPCSRFEMIMVPGLMMPCEFNCHHESVREYHKKYIELYKKVFGRELF